MSDQPSSSMSTLSSESIVHGEASRRRPPSPMLSSPRPAKRSRVSHLTPDSFRNGVVLAPMVRSGALPTRLFALKHGANLVWSPEIVDKAILHTQRVVDPRTGVITYTSNQSKPVFTCHPVEKPYLIYQIGSASPEYAVQAAQHVIQDVAGVDLNCGCPKPFSTHAGMGAALLSTPNLLCDILRSLRESLPPEKTVTAKIRLLPTQDETKKLVERIIGTGVSAITIHCRTRNMRKGEPAVIERLREIVDFVDGLEAVVGRKVPVIANGDCVSRQDAARLKEVTGATSVMIATGAESNPTCFDVEPSPDLEKTLTPRYIRLGKYLDNHFSSTKFCALQFKSPCTKALGKAAKKDIRDVLSKAKSYDDLDGLVEGIWNGEEEMAEITEAIESRESAEMDVSSPSVLAQCAPCPFALLKTEDAFITPGAGRERVNPVPEIFTTPCHPPNSKKGPIPALISGDASTPSPSPA